MRKEIFILPVLWLLGGAPLLASDVVAVLSGASGPYQEALAGLQGVLGPVPNATLPALPDLAGAKVVVTFGSEAALKSYPGSVALVAALLPDPSLQIDHGGSLTKVGLPPAAAVLVAKMKALNPMASELAALNPNGSYSAYLAQLKAAVAAAGMTLVVKKVSSLSDLGATLPGLKGEVQSLWVPPDPLFMNPQTFGILTAFCKGAGIGFFAPVAGLARAGSLAGVAPSFKQVGATAAGAAKAYVAGGSPGAWVYPQRAETTVNTTVAAQLGLSDSVGKADSRVQ